MMKLELIRSMTNEYETAVYNEYKIGEYTIDCCVYNAGTESQRKTIDVYKDYSNRFLPEIFFDGRRYGETVNEFRIQTTSYGSLKPEEIKEVMKGYETALAVVEILKKELVM